MIENSHHPQTQLNRRRMLARTLAATALMTMAGTGLAQAARLDLSQRADRVILQKGKRGLTLISRGQTIAQYRVGLGFTPQGHKLQSGDGRTPEGQYFINRRNPRSEFYLSLGINYPNAQDVARARQMGVNPGGDIFIHGEPMRQGNRYGTGNDWTAGCVAIRNREIEEMWALVPDGTPITILA
jgi:murein L,D-transpeptidase YafK